MRTVCVGSKRESVWEEEGMGGRRGEGIRGRRGWMVISMQYAHAHVELAICTCFC